MPVTHGHKQSGTHCRTRPGFPHPFGWPHPPAVQRLIELAGIKQPETPCKKRDSDVRCVTSSRLCGRHPAGQHSTSRLNLYAPARLLIAAAAAINPFPVPQSGRADWSLADAAAVLLQYALCRCAGDNCIISRAWLTQKPLPHRYRKCFRQMRHTVPDGSTA